MRLTKFLGRLWGVFEATRGVLEIGSTRETLFGKPPFPPLGIPCNIGSRANARQSACQLGAQWCGCSERSVDHHHLAAHAVQQAPKGGANPIAHAWAVHTDRQAIATGTTP